jgi:hypothetical protein
MPLSTHLATRVRAILATPEHWAMLPESVREWLRLQQVKSALPRADGLLVETFPRGGKWFLVAYCFEGRNAHQTLGMLLTRRLERFGFQPLGFVATDYVLATWSAKAPYDVGRLFEEDMLGDDLEAWMAESSMLRRTFRNVAVIAGLIERHHPGQEKSRRQVTVNSDLIYNVLRRHQPDHVLLRATRADAAGGLTDVERIAGLLRRVKGRVRHMSLSRVSPLAVPVLLEIGRESVRSGAGDDALLAEAEEAELAVFGLGAETLPRAETGHAAEPGEEVGAFIRLQINAGGFRHRARHFQRGVEADRVGDFQRAHRHAGLTADIFDDCRLDAFGKHFEAFLGVGAKAAGGVEAAAVIDDNRRLPDFQDIVDRLGEGFLAGFLAHDDLDKTHPLDRREEVDADELVLARERGGELRDRQGGGVGADNGVFAERSFRVGEDLVLQIDVFIDGFDDEVAVFQELIVRGRRDEGEERVALLFRALAARDVFLDEADGVLLALVGRFLLHVHEDCADARACLLVGDACAHEAGANDADFLELCFFKTSRAVCAF